MHPYIPVYTFLSALKDYIFEHGVIKCPTLESVVVLKYLLLSSRYKRLKSDENQTLRQKKEII